MARIRTIKPEFWTDEKIIQLSPFARLLFLGMWNYADDHGGIESSEPQLKMRILPADPVDVHDLLKELLAHGLLIEYSVNDARYYHIKNFPKHQKINRPSNPRVPPYPSLNPHGGLTEDSPREGKGNGMEGKGKDLDLEGKGGDGTEHASPSPPFGGGGAAAPKKINGGNGQGVGDGPVMLGQVIESVGGDVRQLLPKGKKPLQCASLGCTLPGLVEAGGRVWCGEHVVQGYAAQ